MVTYASCGGLLGRLSELREGELLVAWYEPSLFVAANFEPDFAFRNFHETYQETR